MNNRIITEHGKKNMTAICGMEPEPGICMAHMERFYYDSKKKQCSMFIYGGCGGNGNNFVTETECRELCLEGGNDIKFVTASPRLHRDCRLPIIKGKCRSSLSMWAFNADSQKCVPFQYSGCGGNNNKFISESQCHDVCEVRKTKNVCSMSQASSDCGESESTKTNWFYDSANGKCREEESCPSSKVEVNQFATRAECVELCDDELGESEKYHRNPLNRDSASVEMSFDLGDCKLSPEEGVCLKNLTRYYYNATDDSCDKFVFHGCGGNKNNFFTRFECSSTCGNLEQKMAAENATICEEGVRAGPCSGALKRWYFDDMEEKCAEFEYGGCGGNRNRFRSKTECEETCGTPSVEEKIEEAERSGSTAFTVAEGVLGVVLAVLLGVAGFFLFKYYKLRKEKENYRIFSNEQRRRLSGGSVSSTATTISNAMQVAYDNPVYQSNEFQMGRISSNGDEDRQRNNPDEPL